MRHRVTFLTQPNCGLCDQAKAVLDRLAADFPLDVEIVELASERGGQLAHGAGMAFPPGVLLEGKPFSYGRLSERKLRRELQRHPVSPPR